jgi:predicted RNA-binding protein with PUA-like domain
MRYWLMKTEPDECSIDDFATDPAKPIRWDGVRNYQARNFMREMQAGDHVFIYHSSCKNIGVAGVVEVKQAAYPDPTQFSEQSAYFDRKSSKENPRWSAVDLTFVAKFNNVIPLATLKALPELKANPLVQRGSRLSVVPFTKSEWQAVNNISNLAKSG